jgi:hypothetical protein
MKKVILSIAFIISAAIGQSQKLGETRTFTGILRLEYMLEGEYFYVVKIDKNKEIDFYVKTGPLDNNGINYTIKNNFRDISYSDVKEEDNCQVRVKAKYSIGVFSPLTGDKPFKAKIWRLVEMERIYTEDNTHSPK